MKPKSRDRGKAGKGIQRGKGKGMELPRDIYVKVRRVTLGSYGRDATRYHQSLGVNNGLPRVSRAFHICAPHQVGLLLFCHVPSPE